MQIVQQINTYGRYTTDNDECPSRYVLRNDFEERKATDAYTTDNQQQPAPRAERLLETVTDSFAYSLHRHSNTDMYHTDDESKQHLLIVSGFTYLTDNHKLLDKLRQFEVEQTNAETSTKNRTDDCRKDTQRNDQIHHTAQRLGKFLLQNKTQNNQHNSITCITHTKGEKQREEGSQNGSRIELSIVGHTVHLGKHLVHASKSVVTQLDGRIVFFRSIPDLIIDTTVVQQLLYFGFIIDRNPSFQQDNSTISHVFAVEFYLQQVYIPLKQ